MRTGPPTESPVTRGVINLVGSVERTRSKDSVLRVEVGRRVSTVEELPVKLQRRIGRTGIRKRKRWSEFEKHP